MNPYIIIACLLAVIGSGAGGFKLGIDHEQASQAREDQHIAQAVDAANAASAQAIASLKIVHKNISNEVRREVETNTIYRDCVLPANGVQLANQALAGTKPADSSKLPKADTPSK